MTLHGRDLGVVVGEAQRRLFADVEIAAKPGQLGVVVGPNGAGKSTLLRCLAGLQDPTDGAVLLDQRPLREHSSRARARRIAYLPQDTALHHGLLARDVVMLGRLPYLHRFRAPSRSDWNAVDAALAEVELLDLAGRRIGTLSGGERQRLMLARMLATKAEILILDEPIAALDIGHALRFLQLCQRLTRDKKAIVLALHDLVLAHRFGQHALVLGLDGGHGSLCGPTEDTLTPEVLHRAFDVHFTVHDDGTLGLTNLEERGLGGAPGPPVRGKGLGETSR